MASTKQLALGIMETVQAALRRTSLSIELEQLRFQFYIPWSESILQAVGRPEQLKALDVEVDVMEALQLLELCFVALGRKQADVSHLGALILSHRLERVALQEGRATTAVQRSHPSSMAMLADMR